MKRHPFVISLGCMILLLGAGIAGARVQGGPPWAQVADDAGDEAEGDVVLPVEEPEDPVQTRADVEAFFDGFANDCGAAFLGEYDLAEEGTLVAFDDLVARLEDGQRSHGVRSIQVLLGNCERHPNDGLMNALSHHGLNWVKHHEHELWLQEKFADRATAHPATGRGHGKPDKVHGKPDKVHGNPHATSAGGGHANGHAGDHANGHGNAYGHAK